MQNQCLAKNLDSEDSDKVGGLDWLKVYGGLVNTILLCRAAIWWKGYVMQQERVNSINLRSHPARQSCHWAFFAYDGQAALSPSPANHVTSVLMGRPPGSKVDFTTFKQYPALSLDQMKQPGAAWVFVIPLPAVEHCIWPRAARLYNKRKCVSWSIGRPPTLHQETRLPSWRRFTDTRQSKLQAV